MSSKQNRKNKLITPFVKWVGGKRQLLPIIKTHLPNRSEYTKYIEPFIGGGALLFELEPKKAVINDFNEELINVYITIRDHVEELIKDLSKHSNTAEYFYKLRELDRSDEYNQLSKIEKASRFIFLNKTCYNGLYRVNRSGQFNTPFGNYKRPNIVNQPVLKAVSSYLNNNKIEIFNKSYSEILLLADSRTFVYLDPPYHPISKTSNFTGYIPGGWTEEDQVLLKEACDMLSQKNVKFLLSNSSSEFILNLYKDYNISRVKANRSINSNASRRGEVDEVLIKNY